MYRVNFYDVKVAENIDQWPPSIKAKFMWIAELIERHGPMEIKMPYVKGLGDGLFEIRAKGKEGIGRAIFCMSKGKKITILNGFIKKTQKTPRKEMTLSIARKKELKTDEKETRL